MKEVPEPSPHDLARTDGDGRTLLHLAYVRCSSHTNIDLIRAFRARGANPLARDKDGRTPLMLAMRLPVFVKDALILLHLATPEELSATDHEGRDAYDLSQDSGLEIADATWAKLMPEPWKKFNLAVLAAECNLETLQKAVLAGRGPSDLNLRGETCLFAAVYNSQPEVFPYLLSLSPDLDHRDSEGRTVLFRTVSNQSLRPDATWQLLTQGASVNAKDDFGLTPLHLAVRTQDCRMIDHLLALGARPDTEDYSGETPFEVACRFNTSRDVLNSLLEKVLQPQRGLLLQRGLRLAIGACVECEVLETLVRLGAYLNDELLAYAHGWKYWRDMNLNSIAARNAERRMNLESDLPELLVDIDEQDFRTEFAKIVTVMQQEKAWYSVEGLFKGQPQITWEEVKFRRVLDKHVLALGRSDFYDRFMEEFQKSEHRNIFQSDHMVWVDPGDPYLSLNYYIDSAEEIHFSLEGVSPGDFRIAFEKSRRANDRRDLGSPYMTVWEINQVLWSEALSKTIWYSDNEKGFADIVDFDLCFGRHGCKSDTNPASKMAEKESSTKCSDFTSF